MPLLTKKAWFGPKYLGWGWRPVTWEGWVSTLVFVGIVYVDFQYYGQNVYSLIGLIILFCLFAYVTGGKPGSKFFK